jgi:hypothetical protein
LKGAKSELGSLSGQTKQKIHPAEGGGASSTDNVNAMHSHRFLTFADP